MSKYNIIEVYNKFKGQLIIVVSGLSGSGKTKLAKSVFNLLKTECHLFDTELFDLENYCNKENDIFFELPNGVTVTDWDHIDTYNWKKFNEDINKNKIKALVICGAYFPLSKIKFDIDFQLHTKISMKNLLDKRHEFLVKESESTKNCNDAKKILDTKSEWLILDKITFPHYNEYLKESKIDKYLNSNELTPEQIYDSAYSYLIHIIGKYNMDNKKDIDEKLFGLNKVSNNTDNKDQYNVDNLTQLDKTVERKKLEKDIAEDLENVVDNDSGDTSSYDDESIYLGTTGRVDNVDQVVRYFT